MLDMEGLPSRTGVLYGAKPLVYSLSREVESSGGALTKVAEEGDPDEEGRLLVTAAVTAAAAAEDAE